MKNHRIQIVLGAVMAVLILAAPSLAKSWKPLASLQAGGSAKELAVNSPVSHLRVMVTQGNVAINTVVVREGGKKTPYTIGRQYGAKQYFVLDLPAPTLVTGLRISDGGSGSYTVHYK